MTARTPRGRLAVNDRCPFAQSSGRQTAGLSLLPIDFVALRVERLRHDLHRARNSQLSEALAAFLRDLIPPVASPAASHRALAFPRDSLSRMPLGNQREIFAAALARLEPE